MHSQYIYNYGESIIWQERMTPLDFCVFSPCEGVFRKQHKCTDIPEVNEVIICSQRPVWSRFRFYLAVLAAHAALSMHNTVITNHLGKAGCPWLLKQP